MRRIAVEVFGDKQIARRFMRVGRNAADLSDAFDTILDAFEEWTAEQFESRGAFFGTPWDELTDDTVAEKERAGAADPTQPLVRTGALFFSTQGGPGAVREVHADGAEYGSNDPNFGWHHGRVRSADNPVPRRPVFELDAARRAWAMGVLQRAVFDRRGT